MAGVEGLSMSDILNRTLVHALVKVKVARDVKNGLQTTLEMHKQTVEARENRKDGKCNPKSMDGICLVCWSDLE